ncbi:trichoplein keratin filament-binding protein-like [Genypterus blacodes]|uniref:trichoplein keratin filament-binding protein-like n=1 Tax=Genypterus blacodes TaxID=154954 RepID=UPI003F761123
MALLTHGPNQSRVLAAQVARQREQAARWRQQNDLNANYFDRQGVACNRHHVWSSSQSYQRSISAYFKPREKEEKRILLEQHRSRLRAMLQEERFQLQMELENFAPNKDTLAGQVIQKNKDLNTAREERRKNLVHELLKEHWRKTDPELREVTSALQTDHVVKQWQKQLDDKEQQEAAEQEQKRRSDDECERLRKEALERQKDLEEKKKAEDRKTAEDLGKQMEELWMREEQATRLKEEQNALQFQQWEMENEEEERRKAADQRKKSEMGRFLFRQYKAELKRRAQRVQEELEANREVLTAAMVGEVEDKRKQSARRERAVADVAYMKHVIEKQLQLEREREAEFETLYRENAQKLWEKREAAWEKERKGREQLKQEVLAGRQQQVELKMQRKHEAEEELLRRRGELIQEMDFEREIKRKEREIARKLRTARMQEINAELEQRRQEVLEEQCRLEQEEEEDREELRIQEEKLKLEMEKMAMEGYQEKIYRKHR